METNDIYEEDERLSIGSFTIDFYYNLECLFYTVTGELTIHRQLIEFNKNHVQKTERN